MPIASSTGPALCAISSAPTTAEPCARPCCEGARAGSAAARPPARLGKDAVLALPPEEQYLVATGRTYFRDLAFDDLRRMQFDLETTGLDADRDRIFLVAVRDPAGATELLEARDDDDAGEADLIRRLVATMQPPIPTSSRTTTCTASICRSSIAARASSACRSRSAASDRPDCASAPRGAAAPAARTPAAASASSRPAAS